MSAESRKRRLTLCRIDTRSLDKQFNDLDALSRERALSHQESLRLEQIIRELDYRAKRPKRAPLGDRRYNESRANDA